ncbi:hypothetical protein OEA41_001394 [Lepraria neglecta]|uniref:Heterokaryon incompatibility domain-containing protein n=1 Tax=Lepraria neglecta TaxID=209136 RepID=A0AAE0DLV5_9LECA|nr:hypothetical protein OEA41_001394 [Lepraria neglecta]
MRLIDVNTFKQQDQFGHNQTPPYAILSHRWGKHEVSYQNFTDTPKDDFHDGLLREAIDKNAGASKIAHACAQARKAGLEWIWIDTCCIDKTNSTELSRSINSMFKWYEGAQICFAHLADVDAKNTSEGEVAGAIQNSEWFKRGWTLQEMLASRSILFLDANWEPLGSRSELTPLISRATRISPEHLRDFRRANIAQKMSWMADRTTTEEEDMAYCMLGIFDLNMDLRYGEGKKAFVRLQEMIIGSSSDESIFAWRLEKFESSGLLAPWPDCFRYSGDVMLRLDKISYTRAAYQMTGQGLRFPAPLYLVWDVENKTPSHFFGAKNKVVEMTIQCWTMQQGKLRAIVLFLDRVGGYWKRVRCGEWGSAKKVRMEHWMQPGGARSYDIYIPQREIVKGL